MTRPIKTLHCFSKLGTGGIEVWLMNLVRQRDPRLAFDFYLEIPGGLYEQEALELGSHLYYSTSKRTVLRKFGLGDRFSALKELLRTNQYDVVHAHTKELAGRITTIAQKAGVPVRVAHCHNTKLARGKTGFLMNVRYARFRTVNRSQLLASCTDIVACSNEAGRFMMGKYWDTDSRCRPLFCGISLDAFKKADTEITREQVRQKYGIPQDAIVFGHAGSMGTLQKNHFFILEIFRELFHRNENYWLFLAGDGILRPAIVAKAEELGIASRVLAPGNCQVPELMTHGFDAHLLPSKFEGLPVVGMEAAATGLYTVCSDTITRDYTEILSDRVTSISLQQPAGIWADYAEAAIRKRITPEQGIQIIKDSPFFIQSSMDHLIALYRSFKIDEDHRGDEKT